MIKKVLIFVCLLFTLNLIGSLSGFHFKETNALPGDVKIVRSIDIGDYAKAVLFENKNDMTFGVAEIEKSLDSCIGMMELHGVIRLKMVNRFKLVE